MSVATILTTADRHLTAEMWTSLRGLLASHTAMQAIARPQSMLEIAGNSPHAITVATAGAALTWTVPDATGSGTWQITIPDASMRNEHGRYHFTDQGFLLFSDETQPLELEAAVERLLEKLQGIEVPELGKHA